MIIKKNYEKSVADPDFRIRGEGERGEGGEGGHPYPEMKAEPGLKKTNFFGPLGPQLGRKIRGDPHLNPPLTIT